MGKYHTLQNYIAAFVYAITPLLYLSIHSFEPSLLRNAHSFCDASVPVTMRSQRGETRQEERELAVCVERR